MYLVMYYEGYEGYQQTEDMKLFFNKKEAEKWAHSLNVAIAKSSGCKVENLGDFYEVIELKLSDF